MVVEILPVFTPQFRIGLNIDQIESGLTDDLFRISAENAVHRSGKEYKAMLGIGLPVPIRTRLSQFPVPGFAFKQFQVCFMLFTDIENRT